MPHARDRRSSARYGGRGATRRSCIRGGLRGSWRSLVLEPFTASGGWISRPWAAPWWPPPLVRHTSSEVPSSSPLAPHSRGITELAIDGRSASLYKGRPVRHAPSASASRAVSLTVRASSVFVVLI